MSNNAKGYEITPQLAVAAYNTLIEFCGNQIFREKKGCLWCILRSSCPRKSHKAPKDWDAINL